MFCFVFSGSKRLTHEKQYACLHPAFYGFQRLKMKYIFCLHPALYGSRRLKINITFAASFVLLLPAVANKE